MRQSNVELHSHILYMCALSNILSIGYKCNRISHDIFVDTKILKDGISIYNLINTIFLINKLHEHFKKLSG